MTSHLFSQSVRAQKIKEEIGRDVKIGEIERENMRGFDRKEKKYGCIKSFLAQSF